MRARALSRKRRWANGVVEFESLSVPPITEGTAYEPTANRLTEKSRKLLTGLSDSGGIELNTAELTRCASALSQDDATKVEWPPPHNPRVAGSDSGRST